MFPYVKIEVTIYEDGKKKVNLFCGRLCDSCDIFLQVYHSANEKSFLVAHQRMVDFFSEVKDRILTTRRLGRHAGRTKI